MHFWAFIGSLLLASGVAMGAYGAHGLRAIVDVPRSIEAFEYAVQYQLISALGFFAICLGNKPLQGRFSQPGRPPASDRNDRFFSEYLSVGSRSVETLAVGHSDLRRFHDRRLDRYGNCLSDF